VCHELDIVCRACCSNGLHTTATHQPLNDDTDLLHNGRQGKQAELMSHEDQATPEVACQLIRHGVL